MPRPWPHSPNSTFISRSTTCRTRYRIQSGFRRIMSTRPTTRTRRGASSRFSSTAIGEFILPYDAVRRDADPEGTLLEFLQSTYEAAANAATWDRDALECAPGRPGVVRDVA